MEEPKGWLQPLEDTLDDVYNNSSGAARNSLNLQPEKYKQFCDHIQGELFDVTDPEWQSAQILINAVYRRTRQARRRSENVCDLAVDGRLASRQHTDGVLTPAVRKAVTLWAKALGWQKITFRGHRGRSLSGRGYSVPAEGVVIRLEQPSRNQRSKISKRLKGASSPSNERNIT